MVKLSVVIITFNEEKNIGRCIDSVIPVADEIVVVDSFSTDNTRKICLDKHVRFIEHPFEGHIQQKNFALSQASYDHVLSLDADEYLSEKLRISIQSAKAHWNASAYRMNRLSSYGGVWIKHGSWYPDRKIRLWDRRKGIWGGENPHDKVKLVGGAKVRQLQGDLMHRAYLDSKEALNKVQQYSSIFAHENVSRRSSSIAKILGHSVFAFCKSYLFKRGFVDGFEGLMVAAAEGNHVFYKYAKLFEANRQALIGTRIIICRTDNLGDVILTLPIAGYLKRIIPESTIFFIGKKYTKEVIGNCIHVNEFIDKDDILSGKTSLKKLQADTIFFVYPDLKLSSIAKEAGIKNRVSTSHRWFNWIYCNHLVNFSRLKSELHESQLNFKLFKPFGYDRNFDTTSIAELYGIDAAPAFADLLPSGKHNIVVHPKSKGSAKDWGLVNFAALIEILSKKDCHVFITGLKDEGEQMRKEMPRIFELGGVTDLTGKLSLSQLASFMKNVDALVAGSTGVLHLAAALGVPALGLYSPMRPIHPGRWKPIGKYAEHIVIEKKCSSCRYKPQCECILSLSPVAVANRLEKLMIRSGKNR